MELVSVTFRVPVKLDKGLKRLRDATGVPTSVFVRRALAEALKQEQQANLERRKAAS